MSFPMRTTHRLHREGPSFPALQSFPGVAKAKSWLDRFDLNTFCLVSVLVGGILALAMQVGGPDPDLWGHIRYGQEMLERGNLKWEDPYAYTLPFHEPVNPSFPWVRHAWLSQIIIAVGWKYLGALGPWLFRLVLVGGLLGTILLAARATTRNLLEVVFVYTLAWGGIAPGMAFRPQLFTFALFTILLFLIYRTHLARNLAPPWTLAWIPLMLLWANTHGGFLAGLVVMGLIVGVTFVWVITTRGGGEDTRQIRRLFAWSVAGFFGSLLVTLVNPYGWELYRWLWFDQTTPRAIVMVEWRKVQFFTSQFPYLDKQFPLFKILLVVSVLSLIFTRRQRNLFEVLLLGGLAFGGLMQVRHTIFFCVAAAMFIPKHLESAIRGRWLRDISTGTPSLHAQRVIKGGLVAALVVSITVAGFFSRVFTPWGIPMKTADFPMRAIHFLRDNGIRGNLVVWFNWAQFALWHLGPRPANGKTAHNLLAYDGRFRNVYPVGAEEAYMAFHYGKVFLPESEKVPWGALLDNYPTDVVLMAKDWPMLEQMAARTDFERVYDSPQPESAVIFVRTSRYPEIVDKARRGRLVLRPLEPTFRFPGDGAIPARRRPLAGGGQRPSSNDAPSSSPEGLQIRLENPDGDMFEELSGL
ncbi:MAG: hypothetical protein ACE5JS_04180 [Nitrospinota bacterium]